jgi:NAD(P)-dependent dehydrogenase (short-subunit alcohol dehydrogenase family)
MGELDGKVAVITGASRRGFGAAIATLFANEGAIVGINYPDESQEEGAMTVVNSIIHAGGKAIPCKFDVSNWNEVGDCVNSMVKKYGHIDHWVNNAGINHGVVFDNLTLDQWNKTLAVNLTGMFICIKHILPYMITQKKGNIINIASIAPWFASPTMDYNVSKAGVLAVSRTIAKNYGKQGIRCNTIAPGYHATSMNDELKKKRSEDFLNDIPVGFVPGPESIAHAALYLASEEASYVSGHCLIVDGGRTLL